MKKRSLSGIKPTGIPHLGNCLGMILPALELQKSYECFYFIADYHALTNPQVAQTIQQDSFELALSFLALGFNPEEHFLFKQSDVPEVTELSWLLSCVASLGDLTRAHAYKAAKDKGVEGKLNLGTFSYPVLQAADILAYNSDIVPIGKDQAQHIEMCREIVGRFNHQFKETFKAPQEYLKKDYELIPGIDGNKMSKSLNNGIFPFASEKKIKKQIMAIETDSKGLEDKKDPETCLIFQIYSLLATTEEKEVLAAKYRDGNYGYGHAKLELNEKFLSYFSEARNKMEELRKNPEAIHAVLEKGALRAKKEAAQMLKKARAACGLA